MVTTLGELFLKENPEATARELLVYLMGVEAVVPEITPAALRTRRWRSNNCGQSVTNVTAVTQKKCPPDPLKENTKPSLEEEKSKIRFPTSEDVEYAVDAYNQVAELRGLSKVIRITNGRRTKLRQRLIECGSLDEWYEACRKLQQAAFLRGENDRGWRADFDFMLQEKSFNRLREGFYDGKAVQHGRR